MIKKAFTIKSAIFLLTTLLILSSRVSSQTFYFESVVQPESIFLIEGSSNVTGIYCEYESPFPSDTLYHSSTLFEDEFTIAGDTLLLEVKLFDCGKRAINRDLRKTMKSAEFPYIKAWIDTINIEDLDNPKAEISVKLTDQIMSYEIALNSIENERFTQIVGEQEIKLSDFNLDAPEALFGLIKVRNEFNVKFDLYIGKKEGS